MLGKGLESLIPPQRNNNQQGNNAAPQQPQQNQPRENQQPAQSQPQQQQQPNPQPQPVREPVRPLIPSEPQPQPAAHPQTQFQQPRPQPSQQQPRPPQKKEELEQQGAVYHIEIDKVRPNPDQPRRNFNQEALRELANSIREFGFLQPLVVSKIEMESPTGIDVEYQIIAGERRYLAARLLGLPRVPAIVRNVNLEREKLELAVIENIQRENLNPIETARAFQRLQEEFRMTQREIAVKLGKSREAVANTMRLLDLPEYIALALQEGKISESHARLLLAVNEPGLQKQLFDDILENGLTTRDLKSRVEEHSGRSGGGRRGRPPLEEVHLPPEMRVLQEELSSELGAPVEIKKGGNTGRISIAFYSEEELENILRRLRREREI